MASVMYEVDPYGDIDLVLKDPNTQRIVPIINKEVGNDRNETFNNPPLAGRYKIFNTPNNGYADEVDVSNTGSICASGVIEFRMRVSSKRMAFAPPTFRNMPERDWSESSCAPLQSGRRQVQTNGWDAAALAIVLDAIHGRHRDIPKNTNLGLLTRIATIVDYYQCHESVQSMGEGWISTLLTACEVPTVYCKRTFPWLHISWVFSKPDITSHITKILLNESDGLLGVDLVDLPLDAIIDTLENKRRELVNIFITGLKNLHGRLLEEEGCPEARDPICSDTMLGILMRGQHNLKLLDVPLSSGCGGHSISSLKAGIVTPSYDTPSAYDERSCSCTIALRLKLMLEEIERDVKDFDLATEQGRKVEGGGFWLYTLWRHVAHKVW